MSGWRSDEAGFKAGNERNESERQTGRNEKQMGHGHPFNSGYKKLGGLVCFHCGEPGHSTPRCYEIIGYLNWWNFTKKPQKNIEKLWEI